MTKEQYLKAAEARYDQLQKLNQSNNFYNYEVEFVKIWNGLGPEVFENNIGTVSVFEDLYGISGENTGQGL